MALARMGGRPWKERKRKKIRGKAGEVVVKTKVAGVRGKITCRGTPELRCGQPRPAALCGGGVGKKIQKTTAQKGEGDKAWGRA